MAPTPSSCTSIFAAMVAPSVKVGKAESQPSHLLDAHPGRHTGGDHLDHFGRVLAAHMSADDLPPPGLDDQLAEAFRLTVGDGAQQTPERSPRVARRFRGKEWQVRRSLGESQLD
jgi:hypothetical protein